MEALTRAEAAVLLALIGGDWAETERSRIRLSRLPRSTYQEAKRRLYEEGYLIHRFVPDPHALGMDGFRFLVARPFVDEMDPIVRTLAGNPLTVTLWVGQSALFAVQAVPKTGRGAPPVGRTEPDIPGTVVALTAAHRPDQIPIFFDIEGAWARLEGSSAPRSYPRGVPCPRGRGGGEHAPLPPRTAVALGELLARPFGPSVGSGNPAHVAAPFLPRNQRHVLAQGWAAWRVLPSFSKRLAHGGREWRQLIVVVGCLKPGLRMGYVTSALASRTGSSPFLAASDGYRVVLAAFGGVGARASSAFQGSVLGTLKATLNDLQIVREELSTLETPLDLRFDRLPPTPFSSVPDGP